VGPFAGGKFSGKRDCKYVRIEDVLNFVKHLTGGIAPLVLFFSIIPDRCELCACDLFHVPPELIVVDFINSLNVLMAAGIHVPLQARIVLKHGPDVW